MSAREARALTECLFASDNTPEVDGADDLYAVYNEEGQYHIVDLRTRSCTCRDHQYRCSQHREMHCKHVYRVLFREGRPIPEWADRSRIDPLLLRTIEERADDD
ncbi:hypothetical protein ACFQJC_04880 [Haloferax namakaokahaiae]|uniref:SWIM-type domain-containing protein n=1 Tax=Haloferax namakaokahaiae TaxID=1748331 RepID=A0ABD5ZC31_9EURY